MCEYELEGWRMDDGEDMTVVVDGAGTPLTSLCTKEEGALKGEVAPLGHAASRVFQATLMMFGDETWMAHDRGHNV